MRPIGHQAADAAEVAARRRGARRPRRGPGRRAARPPRGCGCRTGSCGPRPTSAQEVHHVQPLARVHAVERLVEDQDGRIVDERRGDLDPLPHALRVAADRAAGGIGAARPSRWRARPRPPASGTPCSARRGDARTAARSGTDRPPRARGRSRCAGRSRGGARSAVPSRRTLAGATARGSRPSCGAASSCRRRSGPSRPVMPGADLEAHVVDGDDVAVPARDAVEREGAHVVIRR